MEDKIRARLLERIYEALEISNHNRFNPGYAKVFSEIYVTLYGQITPTKEETPPPAPAEHSGQVS